MAQIMDVREIPLSDLVIGKSQVRTGSDVAKGIHELATSIRKVGLLEPIVVCPAEKAGKYEIIIGQRRFMALQEIGANTIRAVVLDAKADEATAKALSLTENLIRRDLRLKDKIDACTSLYKRYGSVTAVVEETGLPLSEVRLYVKYDRLMPQLRELVDQGEVEMKAALKAQDAAEAVSEKPDPRDAVKLAKEMATMSGPQREKIVKILGSGPSRPVDDVIEAAKTGEKVTQVVVTLGAEVHRSLQTFASEEGATQDDAAASLIREGLETKGFLEA